MSASTANVEKARSADAALKAYMSCTRCDCEDRLADLLCDLMHWADKSRLGFAGELHRARCHYAAEVAERSTPSRRRKAPPVADGRATFTITIDAQEMLVDYEPH